MRTAIEHAGAERGLLILPRGEDLRIEAEATTDGDTVTVRLPGASVAGARLPESIVHYVVRTQESVILADASARNPFSADTYIGQHHARSVLCLPWLNQGKLIGVLYLENNLTSHVFTPARISGPQTARLGRRRSRWRTPVCMAIFKNGRRRYGGSSTPGSTPSWAWMSRAGSRNGTRRPKRCSAGDARKP